MFSVALKQYELSLFGAICNYNNAFHKFVSPWSGAAIHYGMAKVASAPQGFTLTPVDIDGKTKRPFAGTVLIDARVFLDDQLSERTVSRLEEAETSGSVINWYGYGRLAQGPTLELTISDSSLLYIRDV